MGSGHGCRKRLMKAQSMHNYPDPSPAYVGPATPSTLGFRMAMTRPLDCQALLMHLRSPIITSLLRVLLKHAPSDNPLGIFSQPQHVNNANDGLA